MGFEGVLAGSKLEGQPDLDYSGLPFFRFFLQTLTFPDQCASNCRTRLPWRTSWNLQPFTSLSRRSVNFSCSAAHMYSPNFLHQFGS